MKWWMNHAQPDFMAVEAPDEAAFELLRTVVPSPCAFRLQKALGLTYWAYNPEIEEFAWFQKKPDNLPGFDEKKADIKSILAKYDVEDTAKLLSSIEEAVRNGISAKHRITMQVDTPKPTVFSVSCVRSTIGSKVLVFGLMRNCEKDMKNEMYLLGVRDLLSDFCASSPSAVLLLGNDGAIRDMNDHFKALFEVDKENTLIGFDVRFEERRLGQTLVKKLVDALATKEQFQGRADFALASGSTIDLNYRVFNFQFRDKYGGIAFAADLVPEPNMTSPGLILDSTLVPIVIIDRRSRMITFANDAAKTQLGIDPERVGTEKLSDRLLKPNDMDRFEKSLSVRGCEPRFDIETTVNSRIGVRFQVRANFDQSDPKARAVLEFLPAREEKGFLARIKAALAD